MTTALRPMSTGELLDRTFNLYRNNFVLFAGIATAPAFAAVAAPLVMLALGLPLFLPGTQPDPRTALQGLMVYFLLFLVFYLIGSSLANGATIYAVSKVHMDQAISVSESFKTVFPRVGRILGIVGLIFLRAFGLLFLAYVILVAVLFGLIIGNRGSTGAAAVAGLALLVIIPGLLAAYIFAIRMYFKYSLAVPACVLENTGASQSLKRSSFLSKDSLWRIFLIHLLTGLIGGALSFFLQLPVNFLVKSALRTAIVWQLLATFAAYALSFPISTIAISLVYYDQRVRKEAFDLQVMMEAMGQGPQSQSAAAPIG